MKDLEHIDYSYYRDMFRGEALPLAFVDMDLLDANIDAIATRAGAKKVRIASKSIRCTGLIRYILKRKPRCYSGVLAFHPDEAIHLYRKGIGDILIAYPYCNSRQLERVAAAVKEGALIRLMIDSVEQARAASAAACKIGAVLDLCLDLDMSTRHLTLYFGVYRSPLRGAADAAALAEQIAPLPGLKIGALMGYEAQVAGVGDRIPGKGLRNLLVERLRKRSHRIVAQRRAETVAALRRLGLAIDLVNGGGTGSMEFTRTENAITEIAAGSGFFNSALFDWYSNFRHYPAAAFALEITRAPAAGIFTAAGGGYIASGATGPDKQPMPYLPRGMRPIKNEGFGEVQTPFNCRGAEKLAVGEPVFFRHSKGGELCERFNSLYLVRRGAIEKILPTYRGEGCSFL